MSKERILISSKVMIEKYDENMVLKETHRTKEPKDWKEEKETKEKLKQEEKEHNKQA